MTHGIRITPEQMDILEENNIEYDFYDIDDIFNDSETTEIEMDTHNFEKACEVLGIDFSDDEEE